MINRHFLLFRKENWQFQICICITDICTVLYYIAILYFSYFRETLCYTEASRGCQVKTTKFLLSFFLFFPIKPLFSNSGRFIKVTKIQGWTLYKCYKLSYSGCCIKTTKSIISILSNTSLYFRHHVYKCLLRIFEAFPVSTFQIP